MVIFFGFSVVAPPNSTTTLAFVASAFSVVGALFLILELDHPLSGLIRVPSAPMTKFLVRGWRSWSLIVSRFN